jgi:hypothetical protein
MTPPWAVVVAASAEDVERALAGTAVEVTVCDDGATVVVPRPGVDADEEDVAGTLSAAFGSADVLWFDDEAPAVWRFEAGRRAATLADDPYDVAERRGCPGLLPAPTTDVEESIAVRGASASAVADALEEPLEVVAVEGGGVVRGRAFLIPVAVALSAALGPGVRTYHVLVGPWPGRFVCTRYEQGEEMGCFERPLDPDYGAPLADVEGATTPDGIKAALGLD